MNQKTQLPPAKIKIESIQKLKFGDLDDLCDATESAITEGGGFGWIEVPSRKVLENYWRGVLTIPERELIIGRLDNVVAGSCQLIKPSKNNEAQKNSCSLTTFFLAPWARGYGITPELIKFAENLAKNKQSLGKRHINPKKTYRNESTKLGLSYIKSQFQQFSPNEIRVVQNHQCPLKGH